MTCSLPISCLKDVYFMDHFEDSPWTCGMVLGVWVTFHLLFEGGYIVISLSRYRLLGVSWYLYFIAACLTSRTLTYLRNSEGECCGEGKYGFLSYSYFIRGKRDGPECFLLIRVIISLIWGWKYILKFVLSAPSEINKLER